MYREVTADTMNSTLLSSKTVKSKGKQIFFFFLTYYESLRKLENGMKYMVVSEN